MLVALLIFLLTITLVIWQPRGLGIGCSAMLGAGVALLSGVVHLADILRSGISSGMPRHLHRSDHHQPVLDEAGFFEWAALHVARWGEGTAGSCSP